MKTILPILLILSTVCRAQYSVEVSPANSASDAININNALVSYKDGFLTVILKPGTFRPSAFINAGRRSNVLLKGEDSTAILKPADAYSVSRAGLIRVTAAKLYTAGSESSSLNIQVTAGSNKFIYSNASKLQIGHATRLYGPDNFLVTTDSQTPYSFGTYFTPIAINGNEVTMDHAPKESYVAHSIVQYSWLDNIRIEGIKIDLSAWKDGYAIEVNDATNVTIDGVVAIGKPNSTEGPLMFVHATGHNITVQNSNFRHLRVQAITGCYAVSMSGNNTLVYNNTFFSVMDASEGHGKSYISSNQRVLKNRFYEPGRLAIGFHGNNQGEAAYNIIYTKFAQAISMRHKWSRQHHNYVVIDNTANTYKFNSWLWEYAFDGMQIDSSWYIFKGGSAANNQAIKTSQLIQPMRNLKVFDNNIWGGGFAFGNMGTGNQITNNNLHTYEGKTGKISGANGTVTGNKTISGVAPPNISVVEDAWNHSPYIVDGGTPAPVDTIPEVETPPVLSDCIKVIWSKQ